MTSHFCPHCGETRKGVSPSVENCPNCGGLFPLCPKCESPNVGFVGVDRMGCYGCKDDFQPPAKLRHKGKLSDQGEWDHHWKEVERQSFINNMGTGDIEFAIHLGKNINSFPSYNPLERILYRSKSGYKDMLMRHIADPQKLWELRSKYKSGSPNRGLPNVNWFFQNIVRESDPARRLIWAELIRGGLGKTFSLNERRSIQKMRDEIIFECGLKEMSHKEICLKLDSNDDIKKDSLLEKWGKEVMLNRRLDWLTALCHPDLKNKVKALISKAKKSSHQIVT